MIDHRKHAEEMAEALKELLGSGELFQQTRAIANRALDRYSKAKRDQRNEESKRAQVGMFDAPAVTHRPYSQPGTSLESANALDEKRIRTIRDAVLALLQRCPHTDGQVAEALDMPEDTVRARRVGLVKEGLVFDSGQTSKTKRGRQAIVWTT